MGKRDNRRTPKMLRRKAQRKAKLRRKRQLEAAMAAARAGK